MTWADRPRITLSGLSAIRDGSGPPVLLLHGVGLRSEAWNRQIDALSTSHSVTAIDLPGHGQNSCPASRMMLPDYTDAVLAALMEPALVVGHSMGAMIALDLAVRFPDRVQGVVALNAIFERTPAAADAVRARAASLDEKTSADPSTTLDRWFGDAPSAERSACGDWLRGVDPTAYKMAYTAFAHGDGPPRAAFARLSCPALFMTGEREPNSTPQMSETMAALAPKGTAVIIEDAAHMMPMTHADAVNDALRAFAGEVWR